jgi:hypothetical protein
VRHIQLPRHVARRQPVRLVLDQQPEDGEPGRLCQGGKARMASSDSICRD